MRLFIALIYFLLLVNLSRTDGAIGLQNLLISSNAPKSMMVTYVSSFGSTQCRMRDDLNQKIRDREINYTMDWLSKAIMPDLLSGVRKVDFQFLSDVGSNKDDALMISWNINQMQLKVLDGRFLVIYVRAENDSQVEVDKIFRKVVNYCYHSTKNNVKVRVENISSNATEGAWGRIVVDRGNARGWFAAPIEWCRFGSEITFAFEKVLKQVELKGPINDDYISNLIGGIPLDDARGYLRFDKINRAALAIEYFHKIKRENAAQGVINLNKETKGRKIQ